MVMPTAMTIIHQDTELKECARKTAENGKKILSLLKGNDLVIDNCMAIDRVCAEISGDDELIQVRCIMCLLGLFLVLHTHTALHCFATVLVRTHNI